MGVGVCVGDARERIVVFGFSYLASRDELERAQRSLQVGDIVLEVSQRLSASQYDDHQYVQLTGKLALAMLVSISEGFCLEGLLGAILFSELADILAA
jgi:hypothetical protein